MKKTLILIMAASLLGTACSHNTDKKVELNGVEDTLAWVMGEYYAKNIPAETFFNLDKELLVEAFRHTILDLEQPVNDTTYEGVLQFILMQNYAYQQRKTKQMHKSADSAQSIFFSNLVANNKNVHSHPSGLYYEVVREGSGPKAHYAQRILFDYRSFTLDGKPFDQTYGRRDPILHVVGEPMFPGLIEAFQLMNAGSIYRFYFPYQLVAGENASGSVPAFTPMIYELELHETYND